MNLYVVCYKQVTKLMTCFRYISQWMVFKVVVSVTNSERFNWAHMWVMFVTPAFYAMECWLIICMPSSL